MFSLRMFVITIALTVAGCAAGPDSPSPDAHGANAFKAPEDGRVVLLVDIGADGLVATAVVDQSSGNPRLDEAALAAIRKARFKPYMRNGVAYPARAKVPFDFVKREREQESD